MSEKPEPHDGQSPRRLLTELRTAAPRRRSSLLMAYLQEQLGPRLGMEPSEIGPRDNLMDLGVDSLKAVELKGVIEAELGLELSSSLAFDQPNLEALTGFLLKAADLEASEAPPAPEPLSVSPGEAGGAQESQDTESLSEEQLAELLSAELQGLKSHSGKGRP